jgi:hypothetical protein
VALPSAPQASASPTGHSTGVPAAPSDPALAPTAPQTSAGPAGRSYAADFLFALAVTLLVELSILWTLARGVFKLTASTRRLLGVGALGSLLTLPILWFVLPAWFPPGIAIVLGEALAVVVEALLYWRLLPARLLVALVLSVSANLASFVAG